MITKLHGILHKTIQGNRHNLKFDKEIEKLTEKRKSMGIRELVLDLARKEGLEQGKIEFVKNLLSAERFTVAEIANFANVKENFVLDVQKTLK